MSYISDFNADENNPRYIDPDLKIEYHFTGFPLPLPEAAKRENIRKHGRPRRNPVAPPVIENDFIVVTLPDPGFETQVIHKMPEEPDAKSKG